jgi:hypothetical protein
VIPALIAKLEAELYNPNEGDAFEQQHRAGWNSRSKELLRWLREQQLDVSDTEPMRLELKQKLVEG